MAEKQKLKVLALAYACSPYHGTEYGVGWGWVNAIASSHEIWVITAEFHRDDIERKLREEPLKNKNIHFHYVKHRPWHYQPTKFWKFIDGSLLKVLHNYAYKLWQRDAYQLSKKLHQRIGFDLTHLITYVGFRFPGHLWKLDIPFIWGPVGGLENTPWRFLPYMGLHGCIYYAGRNIINSLHRRFLPSPKKAFHKASGNIIAATKGIRREIYHWYGEDSQIICEIGPPPGVAADHSRRKPGETLRLSWSGLHLPGKALPLLLHALAKIPADLEWKLEILGKGPSTAKWRQLAVKLAVDSRCTWHGQLSRSEAVSLVHDSHIFIITSLKDLTSTVLLEALSQGVPVICPDHCGFSNVITDDCGIKVPLISPDQVSSDIAKAVLILANNEEKRRSLARGGLVRVKDFSWAKKALAIDALYGLAIEKDN